MANWKNLCNLEDVVGKNILLREQYSMSQNVSHYAGIVDRSSDDQFQILTSYGKITLYPDDYIYHFILIDEIKF